MTATYDGVAQLFARYGVANDVRDFAVLEACFTDDVHFVGTVAGATTMGPFTSRPAVLEFYAAALAAGTGQTRHVITNVRLADADDGAVAAFAYLTLFATENGVLEAKFTGVYDCRVVGDEEPRFSSMNLALDGPP